MFGQSGSMLSYKIKLLQAIVCAFLISFMKNHQTLEKPSYTYIFFTMWQLNDRQEGINSKTLQKASKTIYENVLINPTLNFFSKKLQKTRFKKKIKSMNCVTTYLVFTLWFQCNPKICRKTKIQNINYEKCNKKKENCWI